MNNIAKPYHRFISYLIDFSIFNLPFILLVHWISSSSELNTLLDRVVNLLIILLFLSIILPFIKSFMVSSYGGTFGKLLTGTTIVDTEDNKLSFWKAYFRNHIGYMISSMLIWLGFIWIFVSKENRAWHDMIAGTYVKIVNKSMVLAGLVVAIIIITLNIYLVKNSISNFKSNSNIYSQLVR